MTDWQKIEAETLIVNCEVRLVQPGLRRPQMTGPSFWRIFGVYILRRTTTNNLARKNGKMEIKDLAGLSQPMTKLIEVVEKGVGGWAKPWQIKRLANAKAYEIETIARALRNNNEALNLLEYDGEKVKLLCEQRGVSPEVAQELIALNERVMSRLTHREVKRQLNIEKAVHYAMDELLQVEQVSAEPVDEDWIARFFNIVEDVSNEQMQQLWGRILAGEIKQPKSYSLRTLETLRNILTKEAEVFQKVGRYALSLDESIFVLQDHKWFSEGETINIIDMILLQDIGLLLSTAHVKKNVDITAHVKKNVDISERDIHISYGQRTITIKRDDNIKNLTLRTFPFTRAGSELLSLVAHEPSNEDIDYLVRKIKENNNQIIIAVS